MRDIDNTPFAVLRGTIERIADSAAAKLDRQGTPLQSELDALRLALEPIIDGYRHSAIGITGVFGTDKSQSIASLLAQSVVEHERLTTTIARITRRDVVPGEGRGGNGARRCALRRGALNIWPSARPEPGVRHEVEQLELLHWLRAESEFSIVTFDSLGDVVARLPLVKRLDGLVVVNSGRQFDVELMASASGMLEREGVRILGQVRNAKAGADRERERDPGPSG